MNEIGLTILIVALLVVIALLMVALNPAKCIRCGDIASHLGAHGEPLCEECYTRWIKGRF